MPLRWVGHAGKSKLVKLPLDGEASAEVELPTPKREDIVAALVITFFLFFGSFFKTDTRETSETRERAK